MNQLMATMLATSLLIFGSVSAVHAEDASAQMNHAMNATANAPAQAKAKTDKVRHHASKRHHNRHQVAHSGKKRSGHAVTTSSSRRGHRNHAESMQDQKMSMNDAQMEKSASASQDAKPSA